MENKGGDVVTPMGFVQALRMANPTFDQTDNQGNHMQQDSEECLTFIQQTFKNANMKIDIDGK